MLETNGKGSRKGLLWVLIALVLAVAVLFWFMRMVDQSAEPALETAQLPSSEWTTAPEGGVDVDLPETKMTNVPTEEAPTKTN
ncbi:hypothetical protein [Altererythrobacter sp. ZODW24]|uniref:hypothetical protein n=1 Tax=Altererythrobacter sp. ZODW24 TaxID=2185142 RepID=UPI000DF86614|nr:hypothetical protein [Altererythrobacter sp. ZODW24]